MQQGKVGGDCARFFLFSVFGRGQDGISFALIRCQKAMQGREIRGALSGLTSLLDDIHYIKSLASPGAVILMLCLCTILFCPFDTE